MTGETLHKMFAVMRSQASFVLSRDFPGWVEGLGYRKQLTMGPHCLHWDDQQAQMTGGSWSMLA